MYNEEDIMIYAKAIQMYKKLEADVKEKNPGISQNDLCAEMFATTHTMLLENLESQRENPNPEQAQMISTLVEHASAECTSNFMTTQGWKLGEDGKWYK